MIWHGYNDAAVSAYCTQDYVDAVTNRYGAAATSQFLRLFLVPGVSHCGGGDGATPDGLTMLDQMVDWVEKGVAPQSVLGIRRTADGALDRTMPVCAYPQVARYKGTGDVKNAANWSCSAS